MHLSKYDFSTMSGVAWEQVWKAFCASPQFRRRANEIRLPSTGWYITIVLRGRAARDPGATPLGGVDKGGTAQ